MAVKNGSPAGDEVTPARMPAQEPCLERETTTHLRAPAAANTSTANLGKVISYIAEQRTVRLACTLVLRIRLCLALRQPQTGCSSACSSIHCPVYFLMSTN